MKRVRKRPAINFAQEAVRQALLASGYPEDIATSASYRVPSHLSPEFAGIEIELRGAEAMAAEELEMQIERAECELMDCTCQHDAERKLNDLRQVCEAIQTRAVEVSG